MSIRDVAGMCLVAGILSAGDEWSEFAALVRDHDPDKRCQAIEKIRKGRDLKMVQALVPLFADAHPRVRRRATNAVAAVTDEESIRFLAQKALKHPHALVRRSTLEALADIKNKSTLPSVVDCLDDTDAGVRATACEVLDSLKAIDTADALALRFGKDRDAVVRATAFESLAALDAPKAASLADNAQTDKAYEVRLVTAEVSPKLGEETAVRVFIALAADADWRVRHAAFQSARSLRKAACIGPLIDQLAKEKGRLQWECYQVLQDLAGRDLGLEAAPWKTWWAAARDSFEPPKAGGNGLGSAGGTKAQFFQLPIVSTRIMFVLDLSGSMRDPAPGKEGTKLQAAKEGMCQTLRALDDGVGFGILGCGADEQGNYLTREQKTWRRKPALWPASAANKADAERWIKGADARGWTNLWDALEYAFTDDQMDTIFLYTDGGVSRGVWVAAGELLFELAKMNRFRKIVINTVEVPGTTKNAPDNVKLLKDIAALTGGVYKLAESKK